MQQEMLSHFVCGQSAHSGLNTERREKSQQWTVLYAATNREDLGDVDLGIPHEPPWEGLD